MVAHGDAGPPALARALADRAKVEEAADGGGPRRKIEGSSTVPRDLRRSGPWGRWSCWTRPSRASTGKRLSDVELGFVARPGGAPANVAVAASRLGSEAAFVGSVGEDLFGDFIPHVSWRPKGWTTCRR